MAEKILNTRILNKIDSLVNWDKSTLKLKKGELAFAVVEPTAENGLAENAIMVKVGTAEEKTFGELPWSFYAKASDVVTAAKSEAGLKTFISNVIAESGIATNDAMEALAGRVTTAEGEIDALQGLVGTDKVVDQIAAAIADLDLANTYAAKSHKHEIADVNGLGDAIADAKKAGTDANAALEAYKGTNDVAVKANADAIAAIKDDENIDSFADVVAELAKKQNAGDYATKEEAQGYADAKDEAIAAAKKSGDDAMEEAGKKVASVTAGDGSVTVGGTATAPTVAAKLSADADNALTLAEDGLKVVIPSAAEYSIVKAEDSGDYAAVYNLTKDGAVVGASINIPKDMVVKSGSVVGDEIVLVLNDEAATEIKIPVASLIEYVTSGSQAGDMVVITVDETTHKVTASITDGTITAAKLTTELQTAIGKAHSHENADVLAGINADKVAAWDAAEQNAKDYADGLDEAMDGRVQAVEGKSHEHANKDLLDTYTQTEENIADAVTKKHSHANATVLDGIEEADITAWDAKVDSVVGATDSGLKATREGNAITLDFDEGVVLVFDCGDAGVTE